jgi:folate-binding protein YgfZ
MSNSIGIDLGAGDRALGVLAFRGPDAEKFLQGQLSADVSSLWAGASMLAGFHSPQGRTITVMMLARLSPEDIFAVLPRELIAEVSARLRKFVFRAKVSIEESPLRVVGGAAGADPHGCYAFGWSDRQLLLKPEHKELELSPETASWELADLRAGMPQVYAATSEAFVAQMLNLDLLGAIGFDKGCYTGQEVIARAHYRGRVKRRMQRFRNSGALLAPGDSAHSSDGRALSVVRVATAEDGTQEILAIGNFDDGARGPTESLSGTGSVEGPLPLPYTLPE